MTTDNDQSDDLRRRVAKLETEILNLRKIVESIGGEPGHAKPPSVLQTGAPIKPKAGSPPESPKSPAMQPSLRRSSGSGKPRGGFKFPERMKSFEYWLNRIGIGLLLFAVVFLFKYSIDKGWVTPWLRIGFALSLGGGLTAIGLRLYNKRRAFATILLGGAIGVWYVAGFSAFQLLHLVTQPQAMAFMGIVTIYSFILSVRQDVASLSLIGALGGFGTPFLLYTGYGNLPGLMLYTCLLVTLTGALFFFKGWRSLLWTTVLLGWIVMMIGIANQNWFASDITISKQWSVQAGLIVFWLMFGGLPLVRELAWLKKPDRLARSTIGFGDKAISPKINKLFDRHLHIMAASSPIIALLLTNIIWPHVSESVFGWIAGGVASLYVSLALWLNHTESLRPVAYTHGLVAIYFATICLFQVLDGNWLLVSLATEGLILHLMARRIGSQSVRFSAHVISYLAGGWLLVRLTTDSAVLDGFWTAANLSNLWVIAVFSVAAINFRAILSRRIYAVAAIAFLALLFAREFDGNSELILIGCEAFVVYLIGRFSLDVGMRFSSHYLFIVGGYLLVRQFVYADAELTPMLNLKAMSNVVFIGLLGLVTATFEKQTVRQFYALACHLAILGLLASEFSRLENGHGWVSATWAAYGALLLIIGLRRNIHVLRLTAMATLGLLVIKLFLFDLARLETIWRVLLFTGVGGAFLVLGYFFPTLWKDRSEE